MPDGSIHKLLEDKPSLMKGSVPSIFPPINAESNKVLKEECAVKIIYFSTETVKYLKFYFGLRY